MKASEEIENSKARLIEEATGRYFRLFVQDWAESKNIDPGDYPEMAAMLEDFFHFVEEHLNDNLSVETVKDLLLAEAEDVR